MIVYNPKYPDGNQFREYTMEDLRKKLPIYDSFPPKKVELNSNEDILDKPPIETTNLNLHLVYDSDKVVRRGDKELFNRKYGLFGLIGTKSYSTVETFVHDEEDTELSEIP